MSWQFRDAEALGMGGSMQEGENAKMLALEELWIQKG